MTASEGSQALEILLQDDPPEVALVDWDLPSIEGPEMCRLVRDFHHGHDTWIVVLAGSRHEDTADAWRAGAGSCVSTPAPPSALRACVEEGLRKMRAPQARADASDLTSGDVDPTFGESETTFDAGDLSAGLRDPGARRHGARRRRGGDGVRCPRLRDAGRRAYARGRGRLLRIRRDRTTGDRGAWSAASSLLARPSAARPTSRAARPCCRRCSASAEERATAALPGLARPAPQRFRRPFRLPPSVRFPPSFRFLRRPGSRC